MASDFKEQKLKVGSEGIPANLSSYEVVNHKVGNQTNVDENNNKFFSLEVWKCGSEWYCYSNYGRVEMKDYCGVAGLYGPADESTMTDFFEKKFKSKCSKSGGYTEVKFIRAKVGSPKARLRTNGVTEDEIPAEKKKKLEESAKSKAPSVSLVKLHPIVSDLVNQWFRESKSAIQSNAAVNITSDGIETPVGVLSFSQIAKGRTILGEIGQALKNNDDKEVRKLTSAFYSNIPNKMGHKISDSDIINTDALIQIKLDLLDMMDSALEVGGASFVSDADKKYLELGAKISFLEKTDPEWKRLEKLVKSTRGHNHYGTTDKVRNILCLELVDRPKFSSCTIGNELELFHGSRNCNCVGLIKSGLKIAPPEAPRSGLALGRGIYTASASTKSINYSLYPFPGVENSKNCFLFITKCKAGKQMEVFYGKGNEADICRDKGYHSVYAKKGQGLIHDEFVFPSTEQVIITHVIELER